MARSEIKIYVQHFISSLYAYRGDFCIVIRLVVAFYIKRNHGCKLIKNLFRNILSVFSKSATKITSTS